MPKLNELDSAIQEKVLKFYADHTEVLRGLQIAAANEAQKFLWATNGGAAVVLMAYMGSNAAVRDSAAAWISLRAFFGGIFALGLLRAVNYHKAVSLFEGWILRLNKAGVSEIDHAEPMQWLSSAAGQKGWVPPALGYVAFACFLFGSAWAATHIPQVTRAVVQTGNSVSVTAGTSHEVDQLSEQSWSSKLIHDPNATFASAVAVFTGLLVFFGWRQAFELRQTVQATRDAAQALPNIERAYVFVRVLMTETPTLDEAGSQPSRLTVHFTNHGRTPAILEQINAVAHTTDKGRPTKLIDDTLTQLPPGLVIAPGDTYYLPVLYRVSTMDWANVTGLNLALVCYGRIRYLDVLKMHRETGFCWEYQHRDDLQGFNISPETALNRWT